MNIILFEQMPEEGKIARSDPRGQHITKVLRSGVGDTLLLGVVNGPSGRAEITAVDDQWIHVSWNPDRMPAELFPLELLTAQVRPICMKRILREAVSLGVSRIHVTGADTAEKSYRDAHLWTRGEYREYLYHGAQQAVSTRIPELILYDRVDGYLPESGSTAIVLDPSGSSTPLASLDLRSAGRPVVLGVGPERGWSERELELFSSRGFITAGMGSRILRTETACSVGIGLTLHAMGCL